MAAIHLDHFQDDIFRPLLHQIRLQLERRVSPEPTYLINF